MALNHAQGDQPSLMTLLLLSRAVWHVARELFAQKKYKNYGHLSLVHTVRWNSNGVKAASRKTLHHHQCQRPDWMSTWHIIMSCYHDTTIFKDRRPLLPLGFTITSFEIHTPLPGQTNMPLYPDYLQLPRIFQAWTWKCSLEVSRKLKDSTNFLKHFEFNAFIGKAHARS